MGGLHRACGHALRWTRGCSDARGRLAAAIGLVRFFSLAQLQEVLVALEGGARADGPCAGLEARRRLALAALTSALSCSFARLRDEFERGEGPAAAWGGQAGELVSSVCASFLDTDSKAWGAAPAASDAAAALRADRELVAALAYRAMYLTLVPEVELRYPLHFGVCDEASPAARRAVLPLSADAAPTLALPVAGYAYAAHLCLTLPESPTTNSIWPGGGRASLQRKTPSR